MADFDLTDDWPEHHVAWAKRAVLLTDIVGSVGLIEQRRSGHHLPLARFRRPCEAEDPAANNGRLVKSLGDGMLLDFADVRSAVSAALAIQRDAAGPMPAGRPTARSCCASGLEVSDVIVEADDVFGRGVNLAARLMSLAGPGEIVVSQHVRDGLTPSLDADVEDLGDCYVKGIPQPVRAYRVGPPGPQPMVGSAVAFDEMAPSIAVIPFTSRNLANDHGVIGEVLAEEVITAPVPFASELKLVSRLSTTAFSGRNASLEEIGAHLGADYVLSGAYRAANSHFKLDVELAETKSGRILWVETLEDDLPPS